MWLLRLCFGNGLFIAAVGLGRGGCFRLGVVVIMRGYHRSLGGRFLPVVGVGKGVLGAEEEAKRQ